MNIYLKSLEIGYKIKDEGISFNELKAKLKKLNYEFEEDLIRSWFYRSFEHRKRIDYTNKPILGISLEEDNKKLRLCSDSLFQYLEYIELKEARENSISAKKDSKIAILIALLSLLAPLVISVIGFFHQPKSDTQREIQLKELIEINIGNQKVLDSCFYELNKLRIINEQQEKKKKTEQERKVKPKKQKDS